MEKVEVNADLMVQRLLKQIESLSKENAQNYALAVQYKAEVDQLKKEAVEEKTDKKEDKKK